ALTVEGAPTIDERVRALIYSIPIENFLAAMPTRLNPSASAEKEITAAFYFRDTDQRFGIQVRRGVAQFQEGEPQAPDVSVTTSTDVWRRIVLGERNLAVALARGELDVEGGAPALVEFLRLFR
ncbi:MAG: alkyl sulfatase C-terminal domain-containing protein, partial [Pseudomonadota bacterium]